MHSPFVNGTYQLALTALRDPGTAYCPPYQPTTALFQQHGRLAAKIPPSLALHLGGLHESSTPRHPPQEYELDRCLQRRRHGCRGQGHNRRAAGYSCQHRKHAPPLETSLALPGARSGTLGLDGVEHAG